MRRTILILVITLVSGGIASAAAVQIDLGSPGFFNTQLGPFSFSELNGTPVNGSSVSLDFTFTGNEFVRLFSNTTKNFEIGVSLQTNAGTAPGVVSNATAYLVDQNGNALPNVVPDTIGRASSSNGSTFLGFFPLLTDINGTPNTTLSFPMDFYGVHFGFTLPMDRGVQIIGANFTLFGQGDQNSQFEVGPIVPDNGNTLWLLLAAFGALVVARTRFLKT